MALTGAAGNSVDCRGTAGDEDSEDEKEPN